MENKKEKTDSIDQLLGDIMPVEAPEYLLTRIHAQLNKQLEAQISKTWAWVGLVGFVLLFSLNIWTIQQYSSMAIVSDSLMEEMNLIPDNSLYNE